MRRLPFLSNADRRALLVLEWLIILVVIGLFVYSWMQPPTSPRGDASVAPGAASDSRQRGSAQKTYVYATAETPVETFPFDPNTADSTQLLRLGLAPWQVRAVYRYRAKRGRYHTPEDFARLPGMTNEMWERLAPQIRIAERYQYVDVQTIKASAMKDNIASSAADVTKHTDADEPSHKGIPGADTAQQAAHQASSVRATHTEPRDTILYPEKFSQLVQVDLNKADTNQLKKIPGIASYRASQIVRYRESLGGFVSIEQVMESCTLPDEVLDWFCLTHTQTRKININKASVQAMRKHPYISFYQARAIYERRYAKGNFHSADELLTLKEFTQKDVERLTPYIEF